MERVLTASVPLHRHGGRTGAVPFLPMNMKPKNRRGAATAAVFILLGIFSSSLFAVTPTPTPTATPTPHAVSLTDTTVYKGGTGLNAVLRAIDDGHGAFVPACILVDTNGDPVSLGGSSGGDASAANQTAVQANAGSNASKATAVQGITGGKPIVAAIDQTTPGTTNGVQVNAALPAGTNVIGGVTDAGAGWTATCGIAGARFTSADQSGAVASVTDAPISTKKLVITDLIISVDTAMRVDFSVESSATVIESVYMSANSTVNLITRSKRKLATADKKLQVQTSIAGNISVNAFYYSE